MTVFFSQIAAFFTSLALIITGFLGINIDLSKHKVEDFKVTTYVRGEYIQSPDSLHAEDFDIITDVILFECASFNSDGEIIYDKEKLTTALNNLRTAIGERDVHLTLNLLGPWGNTDSDVWEEQMEAQSDEHNKAFTSGVLEDNIVNMLTEYGFDGVHFDYEYPISSKAWRYYNRFLVSLDKKLGDYTLGVAGNSWNIKFTTEAVSVIDTFEVMLYDMIDEEGKHATYEDTVTAVQKVGIYGKIGRAHV